MKTIEEPGVNQAAELVLGEVSGDMTATEFRAVAEAFDMSFEEISTWLGMNKLQGYRYANGAVTIPRPIGKLLRLMTRLNLRPDQV